MSAARWLLLCLAIAGGGSLAVACGPFFPWQLLDDRAATLKAAPANGFAFEMTHLLPAAADRLTAVETGDPPQDGAIDQARAAAEAQGLTRSQVAILGRMRAAPDAAAAAAAGAGLPAAVRDYTAGAVAFRQGDLAAAQGWFQAVLDLDAAAQRPRATWAAYMLGRIAARQGEPARAAAAFARTRALALAGVPDPFGLAVASYGEEARLHLDAAAALPPDPPAPVAASLEAATELYAQQALRGSASGVQSLRMVAERVLGGDAPADPALLRAAVAQPLLQRVLVAYVMARGQDDPGTPPAALAALADALQADGVTPAAPDRIAALCYRLGRYDLAARLVAQASGPLAAWVRAKLALQRGDMAGAAAAYAEAARGFPDTGEATLDAANRRRVVGEAGTLTLARGEYVEALARLYPVAATYWGDVAYVAERVLTVDELKRFVDQHVPAPAAPVTEASRGWDTPNWLVTDPAAQLRDLLARRLVRQQRYQEALPYFHSFQDTAFSDPLARAHVAEYAAARAQATTLWWRIERARAWYTAALLARQHGMGMMGFEGPPDYFALDGEYDMGVGQTRPGDAFVSPGERSRFAASNAVPDLRFHYRFVAVEHAILAADLLPTRSQAFAAVLCQATGWMLSTEARLDLPPNQPNPASRLVSELYARYVREGAAVPWAAHFGRDCPAPDFVAAVGTAPRQMLHDLRRIAREQRPRLALVLAGIGLVVLLWSGCRWHMTRLNGPRDGRR
ncbi:MAG: hypothetical protein J0H67_06530 [Rhodospirillales bacterium]|nr:hypothetical protein [Rhodospirillales bacterium]